MVCSDCRDLYFVPSRMPLVCRDCEGKMIARAAKETDSKALSIASLAAWLQSGQKPVKRDPAWRIA